MRKFLAVFLLLGSLCQAHAAGPRFVTGKPFFTGQAGLAIGWKGPQLLYSTDPADLSATVNHAAADALVAAAAGVWNVPVANITVAQGVPLAEHVSAQNVYLDSAGLHLPADVSATNAQAIPLAVVYDTDGLVTDTLLGAGASSPSGCRQNGVTESVDAFDPAGYIAHALIVINGRCTGTAPAAQLQLRYQLMRVFGRVLGLAWSQTNDNVFTGTPAPTPVQAQNWPILHPIDILCGPYTYQCLPNPFTLRTDDIAGLVAVYPIDGSHGIPAGKQLSYAGAQALYGRLTFPTGEGMAGVNVLVRRMVYTTTQPEPFYVSSAVTGALAHKSTSPFIAADPSAQGSQGAADPSLLGQFFVPWFPLLGTAPVDDRLTSTEPVNPLYTGEYTLGPYAAGNVQPSGSPLAQTAYTIGTGVDYLFATMPDAASTCSNGADQNPSAPMPVPASGWWTGLTCGYGYVGYVSANVQPQRTYTLEVTALDQQGSATTTKLMPVLAQFAAGDNPPSTPPSLASTVTAFNGLTPGTTTMHASTGNATSVRLGIADQRGDGRPDFNYQARLFYADSLAPAQLAATGGSVSISGLGFRAGNAVTVKGVAVTVLSSTANTIVIKVPSAASLGATDKPVDVTVSDRGTGATSTMMAVLTFSPAGSQPASMRLVAAPAGTLYAGDPAPTPFTVRLLGADGVTPVASVPVTLSASSGSVTFAACGGASTCVLLTDSSGLAGSSVTPTAEGNVTLQAVAGTLQQTASFTVIPQATLLRVIAMPESPLRVGVSSASSFYVQSIGPDGIHSMPFRTIIFSVTSGAATFDTCSATPCTIVSNYFGETSVHVTPLAPGPLTLQARDGDLTQTVTLQVLPNVDILTVTHAPPAQFFVGEANGVSFTLFQADGVTPDGGKTITITAPSGITLDVCAQQTCALTPSGNGTATFTVTAAAPGTYTVQAAYGSLTQTVTFTILSHQWHLKILSVPPDNSPTGVVAAQPFRVQVVLDDNVTPAPIQGRSLVLGGANGAVLVTACPYSACEIFSGPDATATAWIIPQQPGPITLSAIYAPLVTSASFTAVGGQRSMIVVSQPGPGGAPINRQSDILVQVLAPDGVTPMGGDPVVFTVLSGPYVFYQGNTFFQGGTGGDGIASVPGLATGYGPVVVQATDGYVTRLISFTAGTPPHVLQLVSTPPSPSYTGMVAARPFAVQVFAADGITPVPGEQVAFTLTTGVASFAGCPQATCVVTTDAQGLASVQVTPLSPGVIGLLAADGGVTQAVLFTAVTPPDVLRITSQPADGSYVGLPAGNAFTLQALLADGLTPAATRSITLSVPTGSATFSACNAAPTCTLLTDANGTLSTIVTPISTGTITLQAADGPTTASATFATVARPDTLNLLAAPSGSQPTGVLATFSVRLLLADGTPDPGKSILFTATNAQFTGCALPCAVLTALDGTASLSATPTNAGPVTLTATYGTLVQSAVFTAYTRPDTLQLLSAPAAGAWVGSPSALPFSVQVLAGDGTPAPGHRVTFTVPTGSAALAACSGASPCVLLADSTGRVTSSVTPTAAGPITLLATDGPAAISATFTALDRPDTLRLLSAPTGTVDAGSPSPTPFTVQLLAADGITPRAGTPITFASTAATFAACPSTPCTLATDSNGQASTHVTPLTFGPITLTATTDNLSLSTTFNAAPIQHNLAALTPTLYLASDAVADVALSTVATQNGLPAPAQTITWTGTPGLQPASVSTLTDTTGTTLQSATAGPLAPGSTATAIACTWSTICAQFEVIAVSNDQLQPTFVSGANQSAPTLMPVTLAITDTLGHLILAAPLTVYQTVTAYTGPCPAQGRCPAAPVLAATVLTAVSDINGRYTFTPLTVESQPTQTEIAISAGTSSLITTTLLRQP